MDVVYVSTGRTFYFFLALKLRLRESQVYPDLITYSTGIQDGLYNAQPETREDDFFFCFGFKERLSPPCDTSHGPARGRVW